MNRYIIVGFLYALSLGRGMRPGSTTTAVTEGTHSGVKLLPWRSLLLLPWYLCLLDSRDCPPPGRSDLCMVRVEYFLRGLSPPDEFLFCLSPSIAPLGHVTHGPRPPHGATSSWKHFKWSPRRRHPHHGSFPPQPHPNGSLDSTKTLATITGHSVTKTVLGVPSVTHTLLPSHTRPLRRARCGK